MEEPLKILIIDDDETDRTLARDALQASGIAAEFVEAADGVAGLSVLRGQIIDCALVNYRLPDTDGLSLLQAARSSGVATPLILLTGPGDDELAVELMRAGANDNLSKARLSRDLLAHSVRHVVRLHRAQAEAMHARSDLLAREQAARAAAEDAKAAAEAREREYRFLAESIPQMVWTATPDGAIDYCNRRWFDYTRLTWEQTQGWGWKSAVHPDDLTEALTRWESAVKSGGDFEVECRYQRGGDGAWRWHLGRAVAMRDGAGNVMRWFGSTTDIHDRREAEEELKEAKEQAEAARESAEAANAAKDQFLAVLSHELRTPLTPVLTTVQSLEAETDLSPELRGSIEMIRRNVELEARLIDDLLDLTRIAKNKLELNLQTTDAHEALGNALEICGEDIRAKRLTLQAEFKAPRHHVKADSARLHQIFWNLIKNAIKFTPEGGKITIHTSNDHTGHNNVDDRRGAARQQPINAAPIQGPAPSPDRLIVEIRDTGIGIEPQVLPRIFEAFEQGERNITRRFGGLGLGLAISKVLVDMQGGRLTADSAGPGCGAIFKMDLATVDPLRPRKTAADANGPAGAPASAGTGTRPPVQRQAGLRILLVDDHEDTTRAMRRLLQTWGHTVSTAHTLGSALDIFRTGGDAAPASGNAAQASASPPCPTSFDLLISDIGLPDGSGLELIRQLHQLYPQDPVRAIALSGFGMEEDVKKSREAGFYSHLTKPIDFQKLQAVIRQATAG